MDFATNSPVFPAIGRHSGGEWGMTFLVWSVAVLTSGLLLWMFSDIVWHGVRALSWDFLTQAPEDAGRAGGISTILVSSSLIAGLCIGIAFPISLATAIYVSEFVNPDRMVGKLISTSLDTLNGVPSIVFGLFGNAFFCKTLGLGFSILAGSLTLACMVLPIMTRAILEGLRSVSQEYRLSTAALGLSRAAALWHLLLPAAIPGIMAGLLLGVGRSFAETAALLFTSGYSVRMPESVLDSGRTLSVHIYELSTNVSGGETNAYGSVLVAMVALLLINVAMLGIAKGWRRRALSFG